MTRRQSQKTEKHISPVTMTHSQLQKRPFATEDKTTSEPMNNSGIDLTRLSIQPKLTIGEPNDKYEKEADQVAAQVVQRIHSPQAAEEENSVQRASNRSSGNVPVQRRSSAPAVPANKEFENSLNQARGGGSSLSHQLKGKMESAMGTDFSGVKIHTGSQANQLSQSIQAKAFTTGQDIFFKQGEYNPSSRGGQELLAHELTHVVQQNSGTVSRASIENITSQAEPTVQRLTVENTDWSQATSVILSTGSAKGVAIISDGTEPVVVKPGEDLAPEVILAGNLMSSVLDSDDESGSEDEWSAHTPSLRLASGRDVREISRLITEQDTIDDGRKEDFLEYLGGGSTIVYGYAPGQDLQDIAKNDTIKKSKAKKKKTPEKQAKKAFSRLSESSVRHLWEDPSVMYQIGRGSGVDVFSGNGDRFLSMFNPKNIRLDLVSKQVIFIDNIQYGPTSPLHSCFNMSPEDSYNAWISQSYVQDFINGDFGVLADKVLDRMKYEEWPENDTPGYGEQVQMAIKGAAPDMSAWFRSGIAATSDALITALSPSNLMNIAKGLPLENKREMLTSAVVRRRALQLGGGTYASLIEGAEAEVEMLMPSWQGADRTVDATERRGLIGNKREKQSTLI